MTLSPGGFRYVSDLVAREAAIVLGPGKEYLVEARLLPLAQAAGHAKVDDYVNALQRSGDVSERRQVVEALTTNETSWFRDNEPFQVLVSHIIPRLCDAQAARRRLTIWSAACSSGQEAYTIAMLMAEHVLPLGWTVDIVATDISEAMLERTSAGSYSQLEVNRGLPAPLLVKHFHRAGTHWQVSDRLRSMVRVQKLNLAAPFPPLPVFDVVFMRNVLIYFDAATKRSVLQRTRQVMNPSGYLILGGAETTLGLDESWERQSVGRTTLNQPASPRPDPSFVSATSGLVPAAEGR